MSHVAGRADDWSAVRDLTPARVGLGRAGGSAPTAAHLSFRAAHARARDAVGHTFDASAIAADLAAAGHASVVVASAAESRAEYVRRPDLGRTLADDSLATLRGLDAEPHDLAIVLCDGLSPRAIGQHGARLAAAIAASGQLDDWSIGVMSIVSNGRVAIGDEIGAALRARFVAVLIGERPGLSVPESIGLYLTFDPRPGRTDAERNCISNIHDQGLEVAAAVRQLANLAMRARLAGLTGVDLKDEDPMTFPSMEPRAASDTSVG